MGSLQCAVVASQEFTSPRNVGDEVPAAILSNMLRAATSLTLYRHVCLRTMARRRPAKERAVQLLLFALSTVEIIPTRVISAPWFLDLNELAVPMI
jgi:hypothetical protein